ncbi:uncharacterized protein EAF01_010138 [Botrytis porri]|uniref:uncharacterized protein n=1 Tax=Botrytis porri TaxID=87229 RepID=UPI001901AD1B|nr:uncharacterized protein EAF01_010138 [Botrytis porri]KAF7894688.1 hypothetical protein EAF01_010138 [Botrytis porri]
MTNIINKASAMIYSRLTDLCLDSILPSRASSASILGGRYTNLLRVWLSDPWKDYEAIMPTTDEGSILACRNGTYFLKVNIGVYEGKNTELLLRALSKIQHPSISKIFDVYCYDSKVFVASEYPELPLVDLDFHIFHFDEWEIATIIKEVLRGSEYLLRQGVSCKDISMSNIRLSINGDIKIALNFNQYVYQRKEKNLNLLHAFLDLPILAEIAEDMMLPRYHMVGAINNGWSLEAFQFLSHCISGTVETSISSTS